MIQDVTQLDRESYELLMESVKDYAIIMLDPEGNIVSWNKGAEEIKGYIANEIIGNHISVFYTPEEIQNGEPRMNNSSNSSSGTVLSLSKTFVA